MNKILKRDLQAAKKALSKRFPKLSEREICQKLTVEYYKRCQK